MPNLMPFGKYRGKPITDLPTGYLIWLSHRVSANGDDRWVRFAAWDELADRGYGVGRPPLPGSYESGRRR